MSPAGLGRSRFLRNTATLQAGALLNGLGGLVTISLLAHLLGARLQGEYYVAVAMYSALALVVNVGLVHATVNQVAGAAARGRTERVVDWLGFLAKASFLLGVLLPVLGWFALPLLARIGAEPSSSREADIVRLAWLLTFTPMLELPRQLVVAALQGTRRMVLLTRLENGQELVRVFCVIAGAILFPSALGPVLGMLVSTAIGSVIALEIYHRARRGEGHPLPPLLAILRRAPKTRLADGLPLSLRIGVMRNLDAMVFDVLPPLVLHAFAGPEWVTYFRAAQRIMNVPLMFMQGISRTALPAMSELKGSHGMAGFRAGWTRVTLIGGGLVAGGILLCLPWIPFAVERLHLFPESYAEPVWGYCLILAVGIVPGAFCIALDTFFIVADRMGVWIKMALAGLVVLVPGTYLACRIDPRAGAAWGFVIAKLWGTLSFVYIASYFRKQARLEART